MEYVKTKPCLKRVDTGIVSSLLYPNKIGFLLEALVDMNKNNYFYNKSHLNKNNASYKKNNYLTISKCEKNTYDIKIHGSMITPDQSYTLKIEEDEIEDIYTLFKINPKLAIDYIIYDPYVNIINFWQTEVKIQ